MGWKKFGSGIRYKHPGSATLKISPQAKSSAIVQSPVLPLALSQIQHRHRNLANDHISAIYKATVNKSQLVEDLKDSRKSEALLIS
jgi:hypothetical protein